MRGRSLPDRSCFSGEGKAARRAVGSRPRVTAFQLVLFRIYFLSLAFKLTKLASPPRIRVRIRPESDAEQQTFPLSDAPDECPSFPRRCRDSSIVIRVGAQKQVSSLLGCLPFPRRLDTYAAENHGELVVTRVVEDVAYLRVPPRPKKWPGQRTKLRTKFLPLATMCTTKSLLQNFEYPSRPCEWGPDRWVTIFGGDVWRRWTGPPTARACGRRWWRKKKMRCLRIDLQGHAVRVWRPGNCEWAGYSVARCRSLRCSSGSGKMPTVGGGAPFETRERAASPSSRRTPR